MWGRQRVQSLLPPLVGLLHVTAGTSRNWTACMYLKASIAQHYPKIINNFKISKVPHIPIILKIPEYRLSYGLTQDFQNKLPLETVIII